MKLNRDFSSYGVYDDIISLIGVLTIYAYKNNKDYSNIINYLIEFDINKSWADEDSLEWMRLKWDDTEDIITLLCDDFDGIYKPICTITNLSIEYFK